jgi:hypothetical protein
MESVFDETGLRGGEDPFPLRLRSGFRLRDWHTGAHRSFQPPPGTL